MNKHKILVLYTSIPSYWVACMRKYVQLFNGEFIVFMDKPDLNAPYLVQDEAGITYHNRDDYTSKELEQLCFSLEPSLIYVCGWKYKSDIVLCKKLKNSVTICGMDNWWHGTIKQILGLLPLKLVLQRAFDFLWVPGEPQIPYAEKLGFGGSKLITGLYSADSDKIRGGEFRLESIRQKFVFIGRLVPEKGIDVLIDTYSRYRNTNPNAWGLEIIGDGPLKKDLSELPGVEIIDFLQPSEIQSRLKDFGVLVLPSLTEPWGVVLHEAARAGWPIIASDMCGATTAFLETGENGYFCKSGSVSSLLESMEKFTNMSPQELQEFSQASKELGGKHDTERWSKTLHDKLRKA